MRRALYLVCCGLVSAVPAHGQDPALPGDRLEWSIPSIAVTGATFAEHRLFWDTAGASAPIDLECTRELPPMICSAEFPALTTGPHAVAVSYVIKLASGRLLQSARSATFRFAVEIEPIAPTGLGIRQEEIVTRQPRTGSLTHYDLELLLGPNMLHARAKQTVIDQLAASSFDPVTRRRIYRQWCGATMTKVRLDDLNDVAPPQARPQQLSLLPD
jgi:hypothetical protein